MGTYVEKRQQLRREESNMKSLPGEENSMIAKLKARGITGANRSAEKDVLSLEQLVALFYRTQEEIRDDFHANILLKLTTRHLN